MESVASREVILATSASVSLHCAFLGVNTLTVVGSDNNDGTLLGVNTVGFVGMSVSRVVTLIVDICLEEVYFLHQHTEDCQLGNRRD